MLIVITLLSCCSSHTAKPVQGEARKSWPTSEGCWRGSYTTNIFTLACNTSPPPPGGKKTLLKGMACFAGAKTFLKQCHCHVRLQSSARPSHPAVYHLLPHKDISQWKRLPVLRVQSYAQAMMNSLFWSREFCTVWYANLGQHRGYENFLL